MIIRGILKVKTVRLLETPEYNERGVRETLQNTDNVQVIIHYTKDWIGASNYLTVSTMQSTKDMVLHVLHFTQAPIFDPPVKMHVPPSRAQGSAASV